MYCPIVYTGHEALKREIDLLRASAGDESDLFLTSTAPASLEVYRSNEYYPKGDDFVFALAWKPYKPGIQRHR